MPMEGKKKSHITNMPKTKRTSHETHSKPKSFQPSFIVLALTAIVLVVGAYNAFMLFSSESLVDKRISEARELARPAVLNVVKIGAEGCGDCYSVDAVLSQIKTTDVNVTKELSLDMESSEAKALIEKYNVKKLPALIITGE